MPSCGKIKYSKRQANTIKNRALLGIKGNEEIGFVCRRKRPDQLGTYHCSICNAWHITSSPPRR